MAVDIAVLGGQDVRAKTGFEEATDAELSQAVTGICSAVSAFVQGAQRRLASDRSALAVARFENARLREQLGLPPEAPSHAENLATRTALGSARAASARVPSTVVMRCPEVPNEESDSAQSDVEPIGVLPSEPPQSASGYWSERNRSQPGLLGRRVLSVAEVADAEATLPGRLCSNGAGNLTSLPASSRSSGTDVYTRPLSSPLTQMSEHLRKRKAKVHNAEGKMSHIGSLPTPVSDPSLEKRSTTFKPLDVVAAFEKAPFVTGRRRVFMDPNHMKERVRGLLMKPDYKVEKLYHSTGVSQAIARSQAFEVVTLAVICFNAIWIGVDTDYNQAAVLVDAETHFVAVENLLCTYFLVEWIVRFMAFRSKREGFIDKWFAFDSVLLMLSMFETWVFSVIVLIIRSSGGLATARSPGGGVIANTSLIRILRLLRLTRMARIVKLFHTFPEAMVLIRAMLVAVRTVGITLIFMLIADYVFAVAFTQLARGTQLEELYFGSVCKSMHTLLVQGAFPDNAAIMEDTLGESFLYWIVFLGFILFSAITIMNMMVGVLVEVVKNAQALEKESLDVKVLRDNLLEAVRETTGADVSDPTAVVLSKSDVWALLETNHALQVLHSTGVDVFGFIDLVDYIFGEESELAFPVLMDAVLQLRSSNIATVKDLVDFRKYMTHELGVIKKEIMQMVNVPALQPSEATTVADAVHVHRPTGIWA